MRSSPVAGHNPLNDPAPARPNAHLPCGRVRRYPSDTGDTEWEILAPWVPASGPVPGRGGRPVVYSRRDIVDAIRYVAHNGGVWRALPADFPPWEVVYHYHHTWTADTTLTRMHTALGDQVRLAEGRDAQPSAAIIDSQSVRAAETVAKSSRSYDKGKNVNGRKRHIATDTTGLLLVILVTAAGVQDRDAGRALLRALRACFPRVAEVWADGGYAGRLVEWATTALKLTVEARAHFEGVGHPVIRSAMPGEDWWFCFPHELTVRQEPHGRIVPIDRWWEAGIAWVRRLLAERPAAELTAGARAANGFPVGEWAEQQRQARVAGGLPPERVQALEGVPGWRW